MITNLQEIDALLADVLNSKKHIPKYRTYKWRLDKGKLGISSRGYHLLF